MIVSAQTLLRLYLIPTIFLVGFVTAFADAPANSSPPLTARAPNTESPAQNPGVGPNIQPVPPKAMPGPAGNLAVAPNHLLISLRTGDTETRKVLLTHGGGTSPVVWLVGQPLTADGLYSLPDTAVMVVSNQSNPTLVQPGQPEPFFLSVSSGNAHSGEYTSDISLYSSNSNAAMQLVIRIKDGPVWPAIVLAVGIALSFILSRYREAGRQHDILILQASKLEQTVATDDGLANAKEFGSALSSRLDLIRTQINEARYADATAQLTIANKMMDDWLSHKPLWIQLYGQLNALRQRAAGNSASNVQTLLTQANAAAIDAPTNGNPDTLMSALGALAVALGQPVVGGALAVASAKPFQFTPGEVSRARACSTAYLVGSYLAVLVLFFFVGYQELYEAKPVFGANRLTDYFALVLWGFGVETTTRTSLASITKSWGIPGFNS